MPGSAVTIDHIRAAAGRIAPYVHRTPVLSSRLINAEAGCDILFKCENLQKVGAFKARGAHNAVLCLTPEQLARGVATHSSGNHAAALALAASHFGVPAYIVMPENAPASKVAAVRAYGGAITFCESTQAARESTLQDLCERTGASFIPPYDHADVIAGQGTTALELAEQLDPAPDFLLTPVSAGSSPCRACRRRSTARGPGAHGPAAGARPAGDRRGAVAGGRAPAGGETRSQCKRGITRADRPLPHRRQCRHRRLPRAAAGVPAAGKRVPPVAAAGRVRRGRADGLPVGQQYGQ